MWESLWTAGIVRGGCLSARCQRLHRRSENRGAGSVRRDCERLFQATTWFPASSDVTPMITEEESLPWYGVPLVLFNGPSLGRHETGRTKARCSRRALPASGDNTLGCTLGASSTMPVSLIKKKKKRKQTRDLEAWPGAEPKLTRRLRGRPAIGASK